MDHKRDDSSRELLAGQIPNMKLLVTRKDTSERVVYRFPLGLEIHITIKGIRFAGTSANFDSEMLNELYRVLKWAGRINRAMKEDKGIPLQDELLGKAKVRIVALEDGRYRGWWVGNSLAFVTADTEEGAYRRLRSGK